MRETEQRRSPGSFCIFCAEHRGEVDFSLEHIVPATIGGKLCLPDAVCKPCNSYLGSNVDVELLKDHEVMAAMQALGWDEERLAALRKHWLVSTETPQGRLRLGCVGEDFEVARQTLPDGSYIVGDSFMSDWFEDRARVARRRRQGNLSDEEIQAEISRVKTEYESAPVDSSVLCGVTDEILVKRSYTLAPKMAPRNAANIDRAIAKMAFEFTFLVAGKQIAADPTYDFLPLADMVRYDKPVGNVLVARMESQAKSFEPVHFLTLELDKTFTHLVVGLFRKITYAVIAPALPPDSLRDLEEKSGLVGICAVQCQMQIDMGKGAVRFGVVLGDGTVHHLGAP